MSDVGFDKPLDYEGDDMSSVNDREYDDTGPNNLPLAESNEEKWEIQEAVDEAIAAGRDNPYLHSEYYYAYKQDGRTIVGLTASMYAHLALIESISVDPDQTQWEEVDGWLTCSVVAHRLAPDDTTLYAEGFGSRPMPQDGRDRQFVKQIVWSIAARNARRQLLPFDLVTTALDNFINAEKGALPGIVTPVNEQKV